MLPQNHLWFFQEGKTIEPNSSDLKSASIIEAFHNQKQFLLTRGRYNQRVQETWLNKSNKKLDIHYETIASKDIQRFAEPLIEGYFLFIF